MHFYHTKHKRIIFKNYYQKLFFKIVLPNNFQKESKIFGERLWPSNALENTV